jgi:hypothetical protein
MPISGVPVSGQSVSGQSVSGQSLSAQALFTQPYPGRPVPAAPVSAKPANGAPIHVEMQHNWFEAEASDPLSTPDVRGMPTAGYAPAPVRLTTTPASAGAGRKTTETAVPRPREAAEDRWRTAADEGWQRAQDASAPKGDGITRSGLPKRIPQAQLVPGGVQEMPRAQNRRSPDDVRGLLAAYTRGVQRGRTDGVAESAAVAPQAPKENEQ